MREDNTAFSGQIFKPSPQERFLLDVNQGAYEAAVSYVVAHINKGRSPGALSILRPDLLIGFAKAWCDAKIIDCSPAMHTYKTVLFEGHKVRAIAGELSAVEALPKFATTASQLTTAMELVIAHKGMISESFANRIYLQYLGAFDPQHIGHRIAICSAMKAAGRYSRTIVHLMSQHPRKKGLQATYYQRYLRSEERLYESSLLDSTKTTLIDIPGGVGLAQHGLEQMKLLADSCGDTRLRWLIGSDKFLLDAATVRHGKSAKKEIIRFLDPTIHIFVVRRPLDDRSMLQRDADYIIDKFGTAITLIEELPYECSPPSSTVVKQLRSEGRIIEADHMELYELLP